MQASLDISLNKTKSLNIMSSARSIYPSAEKAKRQKNTTRQKKKQYTRESKKSRRYIG